MRLKAKQTKNLQNVDNGNLAADFLFVQCRELAMSAGRSFAAKKNVQICGKVFLQSAKTEHIHDVMKFGAPQEKVTHYDEK